MTGKSKIQWTDATWNPLAGCSIVSPGCTNCYAMRQAARIERMGGATHYAGLTETVKGKPVWTGKVALASEKTLLAPLRWKSPRKIFVNSMSDLFHDSVPDEWIDRIFAVMALAPQHTFQILTKRSKRMRGYLLNPWARINIGDRVGNISADGDNDQDAFINGPWPLPNVWLGVTTEDQPRADERIPDLLATPAAVRGVSIEPMLNQIWLRHTSGDRRKRHDWLTGEYGAMYSDGPDFDYGPRLGWVIVAARAAPARGRCTPIGRARCAINARRPACRFSSSTGVNGRG